MPADGAAARPEAPRQRLVDHDHRRRLRRIRIGQRAPRQQGNPHGAEVRGRDRPQKPDGTLLHARSGAPLNSEHANPLPKPVRGRSFIAPTARTPGSVAIRSDSCRKNAIRRSGAVFRPPPNGTRTVSTPDGRNPGSTLRSRMKLRISRPAPISTTTASATSVTTRVLRKRRPAASGSASAAPCAQGLAQAASRALHRRRQAEQNPGR